MPPDLTPESIRAVTFRTTIRGADSAAVARYLDEVAAVIEALQADRDRLATRLGEFADKDLRSEFESVGREVTSVLDAAREAAESMRERATADATRWRSESMAEAEQLRKEAKNDAEALRGDAWTTGSDLLNQTLIEVKRLRESAERDAITITGEAEREAHRLVSGARREAEDLLRSATMDAEKMTAEAEKTRDNMIDRARREAEASQERTRALEQRREELMAELEGVRAALRQMEGTLEAKREDLNLSKTGDTTVRVIPSARPAARESSPGSNWEPGETVRIVRDASEEPEPAPSPSPPKAKAQVIETVPAAPLSDHVPDDESATEPEATAPPAPAVAEPEPAPPDEVEALFASLRSPGEPAAPTPAPGGPASGGEGDVIEPQRPAPTEASPASEIRSADDLIEARDAALLPITNRALRGVKRAVTEAQNIALDGLRTDTRWTPDRVEISETLRADLITLWAESYAAGHDRAEAMTGAKLKRPPTPSTDSPETLGAALVDGLEREMTAVGDGQRERQSAASKVFRAWRTDEAERQVRSLALAGYHRGLVDCAGGRAIVWVAAGKPCTACREAANNPTLSLPPVHPGCECTLVL